jgi:hypothetical protein
VCQSSKVGCRSRVEVDASNKYGLHFSTQPTLIVCGAVDVHGLPVRRTVTPGEAQNIPPNSNRNAPI